jgi:hypothetical protein
MKEKVWRMPQWIGFLIILAIIFLGTTLTAFSPLYANGHYQCDYPYLYLTFLAS